jgi:hypothetical protein
MQAEQNSSTNTDAPTIDGNSRSSTEPELKAAESETASSGDPVGGGQDPHYFSTILWSPEIARLLAMLIEWIVSDLRGVLLIGLPLIGKSHFILYAKRLIAPLLGGAVSVQHWSFLQYMGGGADEVLRVMMLQSGCRAVNARSLATLHERLTQHLAERAIAVGANRIVTFVDELHRLPMELYSVVMSVTSALEAQLLRPCMISIAQMEMQDRVDELHEQAQLQLLGRFFSDVQVFNALSVAAAIETITNLEQVDAQFTERWFPTLHEQGWTLGSLAAPFEQAMQRVQEDMGLVRPLLIPFNCLRPAMKSMFRMLSKVPECAQGLSSDHVYECLRRSGYTQVARHYVQVEV